MKTLVCTLMWGTAYSRYGRMFLSSFFKHWPKNTEFRLVTDTVEDKKLEWGKAIAFKDIPQIDQFKNRWSDTSMAHGSDKDSNKKVFKNGYSFRHDAIKWMPQGFAPHAAIGDCENGDIFVWMDADVATISPVPEDWCEQLLNGKDVACLQRPNTHTEIGFYAMRVNPRTRLAIKNFASYYHTDEVFRLPEWHSAYVFDRALETVSDISIENINKDNRRGHVWPHTALSKHTIHYKGKRKPQ